MKTIFTILFLLLPLSSQAGQEWTEALKALKLVHPSFIILKKNNFHPFLKKEGVRHPMIAKLDLNADGLSDYAFYGYKEKGLGVVYAVINVSGKYKVYKVFDEERKNNLLVRNGRFLSVGRKEQLSALKRDTLQLENYTDEGYTALLSHYYSKTKDQVVPYLGKMD